jgi:glycosyltransferase involved in cell wall biosynthesis
MKVLHIETGRHLYGGALQVCYLLEGLAQHGIENHLVCTANSEISRTATHFATIHAMPMHGELDLLFPLRLLNLIRRHRPDILHVHSRRGADLWSGLCGRISGVPTVVTRRVDNREWPPFARLKYGSYDRVVTISEGIRQVLLSEGLAPEQVVCIHSVVKSEQYQQVRNRDWFTEQFGIPVSAPVIGVIAQLIPRKGHRYLLEILPRLLADFPELRVVFFGQGPLRAELEAYVAEHGLAGVVCFAGFRKDMPKILPCLDLVVHPALMEGLGVSLLQAAAAGIPIVGARAGGIPEIVHDGINGRLVEPGNGEQLYHAVTELLGNTSLRQQFGQAGQEIIRRNFSVDTMVERYLKLYEEC